MLLILYTLEPVDDVFCIFLLIHVEFMSKFFVHCLYNNNNNNTKNNNNNSGNNNKVNRGNNNSKINYIQRESNHPPSIIKQLPLSVESRLSKVSSDENVFIQGQGTITNFIITVIITVINIIIIIIIIQNNNNNNSNSNNNNINNSNNNKVNRGDNNNNNNNNNKNMHREFRAFSQHV